ncbi:MAG: hypothetical protein HKL88_06435, partial [Bacteroidia bacterium]|nr:hypothetical protein [Bacteroidia bacterium]
MKKLLLLLFALNFSFITLQAQWSGVGKGTNWQVYSLYVYSGNLYAGGWFDSAGGKPANDIAQWNGSAWSALGTGIHSLHNYAQVYALTGYGGNLIA